MGPVEYFIMNNPLALLLGVVWVFCSFEAAISARQRGHRWWGWLVCGLLLGPLAWAFAMSLRDYRRDD